ncbi:MAG: Hpt domain-containing protein [Porticoccaceae bacterium]|nr:Hpt domain-containing protein [Porticoccaceae bacterium]
MKMRHSLRGLEWLIEELDSSLSLAREALLAYRESPEDVSQLSFALGYLHQIRGSLTMAECYGAVLFAREIESLLKALLDTPPFSVVDACTALEQAMVALPQYIRMLLAGREDSLGILIREINELRAVRAAALISSCALFMPSTVVFDQRYSAEPGLLNGFTAVEKEMLGKLQRVFQFAVLGYLQQRDLESNQQKIGAVLQRLQTTFNGRSLEVLWRVASIFFTGLLANNIRQCAATRYLLRGLDKTLRSLVGSEASELSDLQPRDLLHNLLFYIALVPQTSAAEAVAKKEFALDQALPALSLAEVDGTLQTLLDGAVIRALCDTLSVDVEALLRTVVTCEGPGEAAQSAIVAVQARADELAATLMMAGQIKLSQSLLGVAAGIDQSLSDVAVSAALNARLQSIQSSLQDWALHYAEAPLASDFLAETAYVVDDAQRALIREVRNNFESIKESIVGYITSSWDGKFLSEIPRQFDHVFGAVEVLGFKRVAIIVEQLGSYISSHLLHSELHPEWAELDALADAITGFEYYLEAIDKGREGEQLEMLRLTIRAMQKLGLDVELEAEQGAVDAADDVVVSEVAEAVASEGDEDDEEDEIDPEIKDIFIEEAREVLSELATNYPTWLLDQSDHEVLNELRRGFHTLKGSGRMVRANVIGDLAWALENMLNKILDTGASAVPESAELLDISLALIPSLVDDFARDEPYLSPYCAGLIAAAEALAKGEPAVLPEDGGQAVNLAGEETAFVSQVPDESEGGHVESEGDKAIQPVVEIFVGEAGAYIETLASFLDDFKQPHEGLRLVPAGVQRALHTLQASAGMVGLIATAELTATLEDFLSELFARGQRVSTGIIAALMTSIEPLRHTLIRLESGEDEDSVSLSVPRADIELARTQWHEQSADNVVPGGLARVQQLMMTGLENVLLADSLLGGWYEQPVLSRSDVEPLVTELVELATAAEGSDVASLAQVCDEFSRSLSDLADQGQGFDGATLAGFKTAHELILKMMDAVAIGQSLSPVPLELLAQLQRQAEVIVVTENEEGSAPEALEATPQVAMSNADVARRVASESHDPEILPFFLEEADDLLEDIENAIQAWRDEPGDVAQAETLNRVLHTLKGGARLAGLSLLGDLSHDLEEQILRQESSLVQGQTAVFDLLFTRYDELHRVLERVKSGGVEASTAEIPTAETPTAETPTAETPTAETPTAETPTAETPTAETPTSETPTADTPATATLPAQDDELDVELEEFAQPQEALEIIADEVAEDDLVPSEVVEAQVAKLHSAELASHTEAQDEAVLAPETLPVLEPPAPAVARAKPAVVVQESVKVPAQVLDNLVNLAGEASIARGRVEQGIGESTGTLDEMTETIARLRNQVRQLGQQTEAQIQFRREQIESSQSADFDPLELDRYSRLQQLSRGLEESGSDLQDLKDTLREKYQAVEGLMLLQSRITQDLQESLMKTRLVPFSRLVPRLRRIVRQVGQELGKQVTLGLNNIDGEMDRSVLEKIITPIEHMLRNAIDHGIESTEQRLAADKPLEGNISLSFQREGGEVVITVADDGMGLDVAAIREKAVSKRMISADTEASDSELLRLIFQPGFSTAATVSQVSGRGVGMDVVKTEVHQLGGSIGIESVLGQGVEFTIRLPFTVSVNRALLVKGGGNLYALPLSSIAGVTQLSRTELEGFYSEPSRRLEYGGLEYQVCPLGRLLQGVQERSPLLSSGKAVLVLVEADHYRYAVEVDAIEGNQEIIVKGLGAQFNNVPGVAGATILASGQVVVILDLPALIRLIGDKSILEGPHETGALLRASSFDPGTDGEAGPKTIMVVDDSVTVRKVTSRVLEREGFRVVTAKDGVEATNILAQVKPDLMLLDIEMPRMDGFEVARVVRASEDFARLPIIMISSRTGEKHQQRARDLGVNEFLGKPYQEDALLNLLDELLDLGFA